MRRDVGEVELEIAGTRKQTRVVQASGPGALFGEKLTFTLPECASPGVSTAVTVARAVRGKHLERRHCACV